MFSLTGKTALITGASSGIGRAIAINMATQGAQVILSGTRREALEETAAQIKGQSHIITADLSQRQACDDLLSQAYEKCEHIDILVNNGGITRDALAMRMKDDDWDMVLEVNLTSAFRLSRGVIKNMMKKRDGRIINMASIVALAGNAGQANYTAAKAGMIAMSKSLALEVANRGITVNCIAPGFIETAITDKIPEKNREALLANIPQARMGQSNDIAAAAVYLASDEASYVTGETINVNGGLFMSS